MIMRLRHIFIASAMTAASLAAPAQDGLDNPVTKAMMEVYDTELAANPDNYEVLFRRANEYYRFNQYLRALNDIEAAIRNIPATDTDLLFSAYELRGNIYQELGKYAEARADFAKALEYDPTSFMALYQKANAEYELGNYAEAKKDYTRMRAMDNRSAEALTGLARVAVQENNLGMAQQYMDDAVSMMPADSDIYVRRSSVRRMLGNNTGAVDDLVMAISIDSNPKAFQELVNLANIDYPSVVSGLTNAVIHAPEQGMFYYIRAQIAQAHKHFMPAVTDYKKIINDNLYSYPGIYNDLAQCYLALCKYNEAADNARHAIGMPGDNRYFYLTVAEVQMAEGKPANAMINIERALEPDPANIEARTQQALCLYQLGKYDEASTIFGEMIMDNPQNYLAYIMQAWVIADGMNQPANALPIYRRLVDATADEDQEGKTPSLTSYRGFALLFSGRKDEALAWADRLIALPDTDGSAHYLAACLYAQAGENAKALECADVSLKRGYADLYQWTKYDAGRINVAPLRKGTALTDLLSKYSYLFE